MPHCDSACGDSSEGSCVIRPSEMPYLRPSRASLRNGTAGCREADIRGSRDITVRFLAYQQNRRHVFPLGPQREIEGQAA